MADIELNFDRGVVLPDHPPIITGGLISAATAVKAGTVLKVSDGVYSAAGNGDTPVAILVKDLDGSASSQKGLILLHGLVVKKRLLNSSQEAPNATLLGKLNDVGIYLNQGGWDDSDYR